MRKFNFLVLMMVLLLVGIKGNSVKAVGNTVVEKKVVKSVTTITSKYKTTSIKKIAIPKGKKIIKRKGKHAYNIKKYNYVYDVNGKYLRRELIKTTNYYRVNAVVHVGKGAKDKALNKLASCESGGNYKINTGNGYYGAFQFDLQTWRSNAKKVGVKDKYPHKATKAEQRLVTRYVISKRGFQPWGSCGAKAKKLNK